MQMFWLPCSTCPIRMFPAGHLSHWSLWDTLDNTWFGFCMIELISGLQRLKPEQWAFWKLSSYAVKHKHVLQLLETTIIDIVPFYLACQRSQWWGNAGKMTQEEDSGNEWKGETAGSWHRSQYWHTVFPAAHITLQPYSCRKTSILCHLDDTTATQHVKEITQFPLFAGENKGKSTGVEFF